MKETITPRHAFAVTLSNPREGHLGEGWPRSRSSLGGDEARGRSGLQKPGGRRPGLYRCRKQPALRAFCAVEGGLGLLNQTSRPAVSIHLYGALAAARQDAAS